MSAVPWPPGLRLEPLAKTHRRKDFDCGQPLVNDWLRSRALQHQTKRLSSTKALIDDRQRVVGFYTLATGQVDFSDLPAELVKKLPHRLLPVAILAWLGLHKSWQRQGLGARLLAQALADCHTAGQLFPFVAIILDCVDAAAKSFYESYDFTELPGRPYRLFLSATQLEAMFNS